MTKHERPLDESPRRGGIYENPRGGYVDADGKTIPETEALRALGLAPEEPEAPVLDIVPDEGASAEAGAGEAAPDDTPIVHGNVFTTEAGDVGTAEAAADEVVPETTQEQTGAEAAPILPTG